MIRTLMFPPKRVKAAVRPFDFADGLLFWRQARSGSLASPSLRVRQSVPVRDRLPISVLPLVAYTALRTYAQLAHVLWRGELD